MSLYYNLCGLTGALFSGYYPVLHVSHDAPKAIKSLSRVVNATICYLLVAKVAEVALAILEAVLFNKITSRPGQVMAFFFTLFFVKAMPGIEKSLHDKFFGHNRSRVF